MNNNIKSLLVLILGVSCMDVGFCSIAQAMEGGPTTSQLMQQFYVVYNNLMENLQSKIFKQYLDKDDAVTIIELMQTFSMAKKDKKIAIIRMVRNILERYLTITYGDEGLFAEEMGPPPRAPLSLFLDGFINDILQQLTYLEILVKKF